MNDWTLVESGRQIDSADHTTLADLVLEVLGKCYSEITLVGSTFYGYRNGIFAAIADADIQRIVRNFNRRLTVRGEAEPIAIMAGTLSGVITMLRAGREQQDFFAEPKPGVVFADGFLRVDAQGLHVEPHSPTHRARHRYEFAFAQSAQPDQFFVFLHDVFRDDPQADREAKQAALQEFMGAAICGIAPRYERALVLFGSGSNGKTRLSEIIQATMPPHSVTALPPHLWRDQYARPLLFGARLNAVPDLTRDELGPAVKGIVSGEGVTARNPGSAAISFRPTAAHLFGCNELPATADKSPGFWRRWLILPMNRSFLNDPARDPEIVSRIVPAELPGIVRWSLDGAVRLIAARGYTLPTSHELAIARWRGTQDAPRLFVEQCTRTCEAKEKGTPARELHAAFLQWGQPYGVELSETAFGGALTAMGHKGARTSKSNVYGLRLKSAA